MSREIKGGTISSTLAPKAAIFKPCFSRRPRWNSRTPAKKKKKLKNKMMKKRAVNARKKNFLISSKLRTPSESKAASSVSKMPIIKALQTARMSACRSTPHEALLAEMAIPLVEPAAKNRKINPLWKRGCRPGKWSLSAKTRRSSSPGATHFWRCPSALRSNSSPLRKTLVTKWLDLGIGVLRISNWISKDRPRRHQTQTFKKSSTVINPKVTAKTWKKSQVWNP